MKISDIDAKLQANFRIRRSQYGEPVDHVDPVLRAIFLTFASEIADLYNSTDNIHLAFLDQLMSGLAMPPRMARPAQTVVRLLPSQTAYLPQATALQGRAETGQILPFLTDAGITASTARVAACFSYQQDKLQLLAPGELPEPIRALHPGLDPVPVKLGPHPALFVAIENLPASHLAGHGFFLDVSATGVNLQTALRSAIWCLAGADGSFRGEGLLRPRRRNAGVLALEWLNEPGKTAPEESEPVGPSLPDGFYSGRVFTMPQVDGDRRAVCAVPVAMEAAVRKIFREAGARTFLGTPRAWIKISLPPDAGNLQSVFNGILLHAVTASNLDCLNQTIVLAEDGTSIPVSLEAGGKGFLVAPCSISDERNSPYLPQFYPSANRNAGRYLLRGGIITLQPAKDSEGQPDKTAHVGLWLTSGKLGNRVGADKVVAPVLPQLVREIRVQNPTSASGGSDGEMYPDARARFASALLSRDRIITRADIETAVRMFDRRIQSVKVLDPEYEWTGSGLRRVVKVAVTLPENAVTALDEIRILREELGEHLQQRALHDTLLAVEVTCS